MGRGKETKKLAMVSYQYVDAILANNIKQPSILVFVYHFALHMHNLNLYYVQSDTSECTALYCVAMPRYPRR